jgi:hypothetical protein
MTAPTAAYHCPTELRYADSDDRTNVVSFVSDSKCNPGTVNTTTLNVVTGETICNCRASQNNRQCWHVELIASAWAMQPTRLVVAQMNDEQLMRAGQKAARMVRVYRRPSWRTLPADRTMLLACRCEYLARERSREAAAIETVAVEVEVAAEDAA